MIYDLTGATLGNALTVQPYSVVVRPRLTVARIQSVVASFYRIPEREMRSNRRHQEVVRPRHVAMYLAKELTFQSFPEIGRRFGDRDHTTVMHGVKAIERLTAIDGVLAYDVERLRRRLVG